MGKIPVRGEHPYALLTLKARSGDFGVSVPLVCRNVAIWNALEEGSIERAMTFMTNMCVTAQTKLSNSPVIQL